MEENRWTVYPVPSKEERAALRCSQLLPWGMWAQCCQMPQFFQEEVETQTYVKLSNLSNTWRLSKQHPWIGFSPGVLRAWNTWEWPLRFHTPLVFWIVCICISHVCISWENDELYLFGESFLSTVMYLYFSLRGPEEDGYVLSTVFGL